MDQPNGILVFAVGSLGALAPEIYRLYKLRRKSPKEIFSFWYYFISLLWAFVGGVFALILPADNLRAAFYAGMTFPMAISTINKHRQKPVLAANERRFRDNIIKAHDMTDVLERDAAPKTPIFKNIIEMFRNHADGLFL